MSTEYDPKTWKDRSVLFENSDDTTQRGGESDIVDAEDDVPGAWPEDVDVRYYTDGSLTLPGKGTSGDGCGVWYPQAFCGDNGHVNYGKSQCNGRGCEGCWRLWCASSARRIVRRLQAYRHAQANGLERRVIHAVISPEFDENTAKTLVQWYDLIPEAYDIAKQAGVRGGVAIPHAWRVRDHVKRAWELHFNDVVDGGIWSWIRKNNQHWRDQVKFSPHIHIIGACEDFTDPGTEGWQSWRIRTCESYGLTKEESYSDLLGLAYYQLSHASYEPDAGKQVVRWFGKLAPAAFSPPEEVSAGALDTIERYTEEVQYASGNTTADDEDDEWCCEHCESEDRHWMWEAGDALQDRNFCEKIGRKQQKRLSTAFRYLIGELQAPPGLKNPRSKEQLEELLEELQKRGGG